MTMCWRSSGLRSSYGWLLVAALMPSWVMAQNRTTVQFVYQLKVNFTTAIPTIDNAVTAVEDTTQALLLELMQKNLGASDTNGDTVILQSTLEDLCWDASVPSDACYTIATEASILVPSNIDPAVVTVATTNLKVQAIWIEDIEKAYPNVIRVSALPKTRSTANEVDASLTIVLKNVASGRIMNANEIGVFESTVLSLLVDSARNYDVSYFSLHSVQVYSQTLVPSSARRLLRELQSGSFDNVVNASLTGDCHGCTPGQVTNMIDDTVNSPNFRKKLQENGQSSSSGSGENTSYFDSVTNTSVSVSSLSGNGFRSKDNSGGSASAATGSTNSDGSQSKSPLELWVILSSCVGLLVAILVVLLVLAGRRRRRRAEAADEMEGEEMEGEEVEEKDYKHDNRRSSSYRKPSDEVTDEDDVY